MTLLAFNTFPESLEALERGEMKYSSAGGDTDADEDGDGDVDTELDADVEIDPEIKEEVDDEEANIEQVSPSEYIHIHRTVH